MMAKKRHRFGGNSWRRTDQSARRRHVVPAPDFIQDVGLYDENRTSIINFLHSQTPPADTVKLVVY